MKSKYKKGDKLKYKSSNPFASGVDEYDFIVISVHNKNTPERTFRYIGFVPQMKMEQWIEEDELYT